MDGNGDELANALRDLAITKGQLSIAQAHLDVCRQECSELLAKDVENSQIIRRLEDEVETAKALASETRKVLLTSTQVVTAASQNEILSRFQSNVLLAFDYQDHLMDLIENHTKGLLQQSEQITHGELVKANELKVNWESACNRMRLMAEEERSRANEQTAIASALSKDNESLKSKLRGTEDKAKFMEGHLKQRISGLHDELSTVNIALQEERTRRESVESASKEEAEINRKCLSELKRTILTLENKAQALADENSDVLVQLESKTAVMSELQAVIDSANNLAASKDLTIQRLHGELDRIAAECATLRTREESLEDEKRRLLSEMESLRAQKNEVTAAAPTLVINVSEVQAKLDRTFAELQSSKDEKLKLFQEKSAADGEIARLNRQLQTAGERLDEAISQLSQSNNMIKALQVEVETARKESLAVAAQLEVSESIPISGTESQDLSLQLESANVRDAEYKEIIRELQLNVELQKIDFEKAIGQSEQQLQASIDEILSVKSQRKELETRIALLETSIGALTNSVSDKESALAATLLIERSLREENRKLSLDLKNAITSNSFEQNSNDREEFAKEMQALMDQLDIHRRNADQKFRDQENDRISLTERLSQAQHLAELERERSEHLEKVLENAERDASASAAMIERLGAEIETLHGRLTASEYQHTSVQSDCMRLSELEASLRLSTARETETSLVAENGSRELERLQAMLSQQSREFEDRASAQSAFYDASVTDLRKDVDHLQSALEQAHERMKNAESAWDLERKLLMAKVAEKVDKTAHRSQRSVAADQSISFPLHVPVELADASTLTSPMSLSPRTFPLVQSVGVQARDLYPLTRSTGSQCVILIDDDNIESVDRATSPMPNTGDDALYSQTSRAPELVHEVSSETFIFLPASGNDGPTAEEVRRIEMELNAMRAASERSREENERTLRDFYLNRYINRDAAYQSEILPASLSYLEEVTDATPARFDNVAESSFELEDDPLISEIRRVTAESLAQTADVIRHQRNVIPL